MRAATRKMITMNIEGFRLPMELDTGAPCSIINKQSFRAIKPSMRLQKTDRKFSSYTGHKITCIGRAPLNVTYGNTTRKLNLYVVEGNLDTLCGREWITQFAKEINFEKLFDEDRTEDAIDLDMFTSNGSAIKAIKVQATGLPEDKKGQLQQILTKYNLVFNTTAGTFKGPEVKVHLKPGAKPIFARARDVPFALRDAYAKEIDKKISAGFYKKVDYSEWASTTHVVTKKTGGIRITGNYKPTLNPQMIIDEHPIPRAEDLFNQMKGATIFAHLDITDAYSHLRIDDEFAHTLTLNTITHGLIRPTRAVYGAANIPAIWQRTMETVLQDIPNVLNFFDDILIYAGNMEELLKTLEKTLEKLQNFGLKLNKSKCIFAASSIEFLGHKIDAQGIHKSTKHIEAIIHAPRPATIEQLQLFLGKATYYSNFIPNLSTLERPLRNVLKTGKFYWY
ncbi:uncharacterized protein K02A2.6-like isoform X2 [Drosophila eugracilis]|nr:uncharacterized protein K02A2.6-like isoform X2 [Drosophila eugracilis]